MVFNETRRQRAAATVNDGSTLTGIEVAADLADEIVDDQHVAILDQALALTVKDRDIRNQRALRGRDRPAGHQGSAAD